MFQQKTMNRAFAFLIASNAAAALVFLGIYLVAGSSLLLIMGAVFGVATLSLLAFMAFVRRRFRDL
jgi:hypothetical protein